MCIICSWCPGQKIICITIYIEISISVYLYLHLYLYLYLQRKSKWRLCLIDSRHVEAFLESLHWVTVRCLQDELVLPVVAWTCSEQQCIWSCAGSFDGRDGGIFQGSSEKPWNMVDFSASSCDNMLFRWPTAALWWHTRRLRPGYFF